MRYFVVCSQCDWLFCVTTVCIIVQNTNLFTCHSLHIIIIYRLVTHVDRESTHAASLIVNIAQDNVTRPWTIEVSLFLNEC